MLDAPKILRLLTDHKVQFVVVGGLAMITHGSAHVTDDLDICYERSDANMAALAAALSGVHSALRGAPQDLPFRLDTETIRAGLNFTLTTDLGPIDLFGELPGIGRFPDVVDLSETHEIYGMQIRVLSLEGLIIAKTAAGRTKDQMHLLELEELRRLRDEQR